MKPWKNQNQKNKMNQKKPDNWDDNVEKGAAMRRWDPDIPAMENYRDMPGCAEQQRFIDELPKFLEEASKSGKRLADFRAEIDKKVRKDAGEQPEGAVWFDQVQFYKEVEEVLKGKRKLGDEKKLEATLREIYENYDKIKELNAEIFIMKNNLSDLEHKLVEKEGTDEESKIRNTITAQQREIYENMQERAKVLAAETTPKKILAAKTMNAVKKALQEESFIINEKFGIKIAKFFRERQVLITQSTMYTGDTPDQFAKKLEIQGKIETIDIQLDKLKTKLIEYKSKKPIFLFERLVGIKSIPLLNRFGQSSTLDFTYEEERKKQEEEEEEEKKKKQGSTT
ncbi:hypothetical protein C0416_05500 [bacterium]|nr:hypothetical protein [bacterium]